MDIPNKVNGSPRQPLGRLVVLVDNAVKNDSRVQKQARAAVDTGWQVTLLGKAPAKRKASWDEDGVEVRLLKVALPLGRSRRHFRRSWRFPLAYPPGHTVRYRVQRVKARRAELTQRRATIANTANEGVNPVWIQALRVWWQLSSLAAKVLRRWVSWREHQTAAAAASSDSAGAAWMARWWARLRGPRAWRQLDRSLWDYELAYGPVLDEIRPDVIHANDFRMLGVGARAKTRARARGQDVKLVWDAHEYLPGLKPWSTSAAWHPAMCAHEREYAPHADAVVTVSDELAEALRRRHQLPVQPTVVLNAPHRINEPGPDLREKCGVTSSDNLLVYSGAAAEQRGIDIMVRALPLQPDVHVALIVNKPISAYMTQIAELAAELSVADRVHVLPYVPHEQLVSFLSGADAGVIPLHRWPNHEIALITKFFEYSHARLPIIVSDVRAMARATRRTGQGEVFWERNVNDYSRAVRQVLSAPDSYRAAYDRSGLLDQWTWEAQGAVLTDTYARLRQQQTASGVPALANAPALLPDSAGTLTTQGK